MTTSSQEECYVVDASVAIKLFVQETLSDTAQAFFDRMANQPEIRLYAPDLYYLECANILWKYVNRFNMPPAQAKHNLSDLVDLAITRIESATVLDAAFQLALTYGISVYDACYVATGRLVDAPLVTADERLIQKLGSQKGWVRSLADMNSFSS